MAELDPVELGIGYLHSFAYLSCETILFRHGVINQPPGCITLVSAKSARFTIGQNHYLARQMKAAYLFNPAGITKTSPYQTASAARAVADMLYFNPGCYFDAPNLVDWDEAARIQEQVGYGQLSRATGKT